MPVNGIELAAGQKWETIYGSAVILEDSPGSRLYIFRAVYEDGEWSTVTKDGKLWDSDSDSYLKELIYDPEQQVKDELNMKFNPKSEPTKLFLPVPGDKIICNNGEEFICCTLEFLRETIYEGIKSDKPILGYRKFGYDEAWTDWDEEALSYPEEYGIREVIPQSSEALTDKKEEEVKEDVKYKAGQPLYTLQEIKEAWHNSGWVSSTMSWNTFRKNLMKNDDDFQEYLRLKAIYE